MQVRVTENLVGLVDQPSGVALMTRLQAEKVRAWCELRGWAPSIGEHYHSGMVKCTVHVKVDRVSRCITIAEAGRILLAVNAGQLARGS